MRKTNNSKKLFSLEELYLKYTKERTKKSLSLLLDGFLQNKESTLLILFYLNNHHDAGDAKAEIAGKILKYIPGKKIENFNYYLNKTIKNHCFTVLKRKKIALERIISEENLHEIMDSSIYDSPIDREEVNKKIYEAISNLTEHQQTAIKMHYFQDMKYAEIADEMNQPQKKIKSFIQNGKRNLIIKLLPLLSKD